MQSYFPQCTALACGKLALGMRKGSRSVNEGHEPFRFAELFPLREQMARMAPLEPYRARDGASLFMRRYAAATDRYLILLHGSSGHGAYLHAFAESLSGSGAANVILPDVRGHGLAPQRRGDIDYIGQLEDDLADLIGQIRQGKPDARVFVGGHSSGGGLALRFGGSRHGAQADGFVLLAPYLGHAAPMVKPGAGGWAKADLRRIAAQMALHWIGITRHGGVPVLRFNLPEQYRNGHETLEYSYRLMRGMHPDDYRAALRATRQPLMIVVGSGDEAFHAQGFKAGVAPYKPDARISFVEGGSHLGIIMSEPAMAEVARWLAER